MKNIERLTKHITAHGSKGIMIHTVPKTRNWIVCQKIEKDKWLLSLCDPMGNVTYNLGSVNNDQHVKLWLDLTKIDIENKSSQIKMTNELKERIYNFKKRNENTFKNFIKQKIIKQNEKPDIKTKKIIKRMVQQKL